MTLMLCDIIHVDTDHELELLGRGPEVRGLLNKITKSDNDFVCCPTKLRITN